MCAPIIWPDASLTVCSVSGAREQAEDSICFFQLCDKGAQAAKRVMGQGKVGMYSLSTPEGIPAPQ